MSDEERNSCKLAVRQVERRIVNGISSAKWGHVLSVAAVRRGSHPPVPLGCLGEKGRLESNRELRETRQPTTIDDESGARIVLIGAMGHIGDESRPVAPHKASG